MESELKPCCGTIPVKPISEIDRGDTSKCWRIRCWKCGDQIKTFKGRAHAISLWNTRATPAPDREMLSSILNFSLGRLWDARKIHLTDVPNVEDVIDEFLKSEEAGEVKVEMQDLDPEHAKMVTKNFKKLLA